jgi:hypothetical protein
MIRASWSVWSGWLKWHYGGCKDAGHASSIGGEINSLRRHPEVRAVFGAPQDDDFDVVTTPKRFAHLRAK